MRSLRLAPLLAALACGHAAYGPLAPPEITAPPPPGVARLWRGRVAAARADAYAAYLAEALGRLRTLPGNLGYEVLRDDEGAEAEFLVVSYWTGAAAVRAYAGEDLGRARPLPRDPEFLVAPAPRARNYRVVAQDLPR